MFELFFRSKETYASLSNHGNIFGLKETPASLKNQGNVLMSEGRVAEAEHLYRKATELAPSFMAAHYNLGNSLRIQNRFEEALVAYETALRLAPDDYEIYMNIGATLIELGRAADALGAFSRANDLMPAAAEPLVNMGLALERLGHIEESMMSRDYAIELDLPRPIYASNLDIALQLQNKFDAAIEHYRKALSLKPDFAEAHNNLGFALQSQGKLDAAAEHYHKALLIKPDFAEAHNNLGNVLQAQGNLEAAIESYQRAIAIKPDFADAHYNLGNAHKDLRQFAEAEASYRNALMINPGHIKALDSLGGLQMESGHPDEALACFQQVIKLDPENGTASHFIASITGIHSECAPSQYIAELFDGFANNFEASLAELHYETPRNLVALIAEIAEPTAGKWDVLDLGCGTGLVGSAIAPYARQLVGVDLSAGMLAKAHDKEVYQRLERLELLTMMKDEVTSSYDVIIAADVFIYVGRLNSVLEEIKRLLRPGGMLAFSAEAMDVPSGEEGAIGDGRDYRLNNTGRYTHSSNYINRIAHMNGLTKLRLIRDNIRLEKGEPVQGWLVVLENTAPKDDVS